MRNNMIHQSMAGRAPIQAPVQPGAYVTSFPYYSRVLFRADAEEYTTEDEAVGQVYDFAAGVKRIAFGYSQGQEWEIAGATTALDGRATFAETNLAKPSETIAGEELEIQGIAIAVEPAITDGEYFTDARLVAMIATNVEISLSVNGGANAAQLGTLLQIAGAGGLSGVGYDSLVGNAHHNTFGSISNGWAVRSNFYRLPEGIVWTPSGQADSMLQVIFETSRAFRLYEGGDRENFPGAQDRTAPERIAALFKVHLIARARSGRSRMR